MKRSITLIIIILFCATAVFAQAQPVTLTFTGRDASNQYIPLTRVVVSNLTKGWQETLVWPDTVLVMTATGIGDFESFRETSLRLSQNSPNPFDGTTFVNLQVAEPGDVELVLTDIAGRVVETFHETSLQPGYHPLRITLSSPGLYFLTARQDGRTASVKMVNRGNGGGNAIAFAGIVETLHATSLPHVMQVQDASQTVVLTFSNSQSDGLPCPATPTVTDHEGNVYATVQIGDQCWMRDNLRTTTSPSTGTYLISAAGTDYTCTGKQAFWYNNDSATYAPMNYGLLYNWNAAVDTFNTAYGETSVNTDYNNAVFVTFSGHRRGICPAGWHLPSDAEWTALTDYVSSQSGYTFGGNSSFIAKALASTEGWNTIDSTCAVGNDPSLNNATGFSAVPAGYCDASSFEIETAGAGLSAYFWSSTEYSMIYPWIRGLDYNYADVVRHESLTGYGYSVRCLRD